MDGVKLTSLFSPNMGGDVPLPKEVLGVLPNDPYEQLELAYQITCHAFAHKVAAMEAESHQLRQGLAARGSQVKALESRLAATQVELQDAQDKAQQASEAAEQAVAERGALATTVRRLTRDVSRLENFKRNLLQSLQAEDFESFLAQTQQRDDEDDDAPIEYSTTERNSNGAAYSRTTGGGGGPPHYTGDDGGANLGDSYTPGATGFFNRFKGSPHAASGRSGAGAYNSTTTPHGSSGKPGALPRLDGKEFFRQARTRLSNEAFSKFLTTIKELNGGKQTREETLAKAQKIFGVANSDLYGSFEGLLSRHLPPM